MDELAEIKRARKEMQKKAAADARAWRLTEPMRHAVLAMYSLADYDAEPAVIYLQARRRQHQWPEKSDTAVARLVEDLFAASDSEEFAALQDVSPRMSLIRGSLACALNLSLSSVLAILHLAHLL